MNNVIDILQATRIALCTKTKTLSLDQLNEIPVGYNNNILWNLGHIVCVQQQLIYGLSGMPFVVDSFISSNFRNKSKPESAYSQSEADLVLDALINTIPQLEIDYHSGKLVNSTPFISKTINRTFDKIDDIIVFNLYHEGIHTGVIQKYMQILGL